MITYIPNRDTEKVYIDGKHVGTIMPLGKMWQYVPKNCKIGGECFATVAEVKRSLEN